MTEPWQEPVRGAPLPPAAFRLGGLERLRAWGRVLPPTPMSHLLGIRTTQIVNGSAVMSMPVTAWLSHADGAIEVGLLGAAVCGVAGDTILEPAQLIRPLYIDMRPLRVVRDGSRTLVGRASVVRASREWVYVEGHVEDGEGRAVANMSAHLEIEAADFPLPPEPLELPQYGAPTYPTPDPYQRAVPRERHEVIDRFHREGSLATLRAVAEGGAPSPPLYALLGIRPVEVDEGVMSTELTTSGWLRATHPNRVMGNFLNTQAVDAGVGAAWTIVPESRRPAILDYDTLFVGSAPADGRPITAKAVAEPLGNEVVRSTVETFDGDHRIAITNVSIRLVAAPTRHRAASDRALATVLFTDLVGSTAAASELGDVGWRALLERHQSSVRRLLEDHGGREVKSTGDGFLATFEAPSAAVSCAREIVEEAGRLGLDVRAGVHTGEVELVGGDIAGITVHIASRIEQAASPEEVLVSETVRTLIAGAGFRFEDRGTHQLRGVDQPVRLYAVTSS